MQESIMLQPLRFLYAAGGTSKFSSHHRYKKHLGRLYPFNEYKPI
ncbi:MAG: hypothetical protein RSC16_09985 [Enterococcus sp.]